MRILRRLPVAVAAAAAAVVLATTVTEATPSRAAAFWWPVFSSSVHQVTAAELGRSYRAGCPVGPVDLRRVHLRYFTFEGRQARGDLIVHKDSVASVQAVFARLYAARFPIRRMLPVSHYGGDDDASMRADNTSAFNCRPITGGTGWSRHAYGRAIDVNPVENPYVDGSTVLPSTGAAFVARTPVRPGMIVAGGVVDQAFTANGWTWGGRYRTLKDWQHFER